MIGFTRQIAQERWSNPALFSLAEGLPRTALQLRVGPRNQGMSSYAIVANSSPPLTVSANDLPLPYSAFISIDLDGGFVTNG